MILNFFNSKDDYINHLNSSYKTVETFFKILIIIFLIINIIRISFKFKGFFMLFSFLVLSVLCFIFYILYLFISKLIFSIIRKLYFDKNLNKLITNYPNMIGYKTLEINETSLSIKSNSSIVNYDYSKMLLITNNKDYLGISYNKKLLCYIPINVFNSKHEQECFTKILKLKISKYKK